MNIREWISGLRADAVYASRSLAREPSLVAGVVCTLAIAVGANAAMFGVVRQLMLAAPPGIQQPDRVAKVKLVRVSEDGDVYAMTTTSYPTLATLQAQTQAFAGAAGEARDSVFMGRDEAATQIASLGVSGNYFTVLGAHPFRGRFFDASDDEGVTGNSVVVLSHAFWRRQFLGSIGVLGTQIILRGEPFTIVGVAAPGFRGDDVAPVDVFVPLSASLRAQTPNWRTTQYLNLLNIVVRFRDGMPPATAAAIATSAMRGAAGASSNDFVRSIEFQPIIPGAAARQSPQGRIALWLTGVSVVMLLIAIANVATLLLLRALRRRREIAVRIALGAGRGRLARQLMTESLMLAIVGAAAGVVLSGWLSGVIRRTLLPNLAPSERFIDAHVMWATLALAVVAGIVSGFAPLSQVGQLRVTADLHGAGASGSVQRAAGQRLLVGLQVAMCTVLLFGAALFVRSLYLIEAQDLGFSTTNLLLAELDFRGHLSGPDRDLAYMDAVRRVQAVPGVSRATVVEAIPFGFHHIPPISVPGRATPPGAGVQLPALYAATAAYLDLLHVKLIQGRLLTDGDVAGSPLVVLVNETMAKSVWPGESAIGKCIRFGYDPNFGPPGPLASPRLPCREVVGVVRDSRARSIEPTGHEASLMQYYVPFAQLPNRPMPGASNVNAILVGTRHDERTMVTAVARALQSNTSAPAFARVRPYQDLLDPQLRSWRLGATLFTIFGAVALVIAALGAFGVVSYLAAQRTKEMGIRLALGGSRGTVARLVVEQSVRLVGVGVLVGLGVAIVVAPAARTMLFETSPRDVRLAVAAGGTLFVVSVLAALFPAWRASRLDPVRALRDD